MSDTQPKLPGLSRLTEAELRNQYETETGHAVPDDLTTVAGLRDALKAHRATQGHDDEPAQGDDPMLFPITPQRLRGALAVSSDAEVHALHEEVLSELKERGFVLGVQEETVAPPAPVKEAVPMVHAVNEAGEERAFTAQSWDLLGQDKAGWMLAVAKPAE